MISQKPIICLLDSQSETNLRSRRLEVKGARKNGCVRETHKGRGIAAFTCFLRVRKIPLG